MIIHASTPFFSESKPVTSLKLHGIAAIQKDKTSNITQRIAIDSVDELAELLSKDVQSKTTTIEIKTTNALADKLVSDMF